MDKRHPTSKKTSKVKNKNSVNSCCPMKSLPACKNVDGKDKPIIPKAVPEKGLQDKNSLSNCKLENYNIPHAAHSNAYREPPYKYFDYCYERNDESVCYTSDFFKPTLEDHPKNKNFKSKSNLEKKAMKEEMFSSVHQYKNSKASFARIYHRWLPERQSTITQLRSLLREIHDKTTQYYEGQTAFKELSYNSRHFKGTTENQAIDFFASLTAFVSDAFSGLGSVAQTLKMDSYQTRFQEIMDKDAEITKELYISRSQCVSQYRGIEEVIRRFQPNTLASTVDKISDTLHVDKHLAAMKNAYEKKDMSELLDEVCKFFDNACETEVLETVGASVNEYMTDNPAALEACKSTGKVVYGALDTFSEKKHKNSAIGYANQISNSYLMAKDKEEVDHLKNIVQEDTHKSKLESRIEEAIDTFDNEMKEMRKIYFELFCSYNSD